MSRAVQRSGSRSQRLAQGNGVRWLRKNRLDVATAASVLLSVLVGLVGNYIAGSWSWASLAMLVVLAISLVGLEVLRQRLRNHEEPADHRSSSGSSSSMAVAIGNQGTITGDWVIAGGDVYQVHRETKIGTGAVLLIALVAASVVLAAGRIETGAERPPTAAPGSRTGPTPPEVSSGYSRSSLIMSGEDFDPPKATNNLADASFNDDSGLSLLNGASVAPTPAGKLLSAETCRAPAADAWSSSIPMAALHPGLQQCLHTSDDRWGTLAITRVESNALGGFLQVTWTVWPAS